LYASSLKNALAVLIVNTFSPKIEVILGAVTFKLELFSLATLLMASNLNDIGVGFNLEDA
jgi:hypothetical protein